MVSTVTPSSDLRNRALPGEGLDGVVRVASNGYYGTGVLLYDGQAVLTAAHLFGSGSNAATVYFETLAGDQSIQASRVLIHPGYDNPNENNDLALVWLSSPAPLAAERHELYRHGDEVGQVVTLVGYGRPGTGAGGTVEYSGEPLRQKANNRIDADVGLLKQYLGAGMAWNPQAGTQFVADFDNGTHPNDALGRLLGLPDLGVASEGIISPGDSGGPAFIDGRVAGTASYTTRLSTYRDDPDIDTALNSSYGEIAAWQRVSAYQQWIDESLRQHYPDAPTTPSEVRKSLPEGHSGASLAYFLLQFTGVRASADAILSVDFTTRDGTARAGEDYLPVLGTLRLYPDENQAVIPVEIVGDRQDEADETFYLEVSNPVGGSFGDGVATLTAVRTILDDDGWLP